MRLWYSVSVPLGRAMRTVNELCATSPLDAAGQAPHRCGAGEHLPRIDAGQHIQGLGELGIAGGFNGLQLPTPDQRQRFDRLARRCS